ncbi:uncharacterized protein LOC120703589 isoform X3 [Panicum virgatum]|uniref:uncharacterized protein LOC120703589 isoform X3 n=1 Tax=Panicum virgatum TaxID=38727 RepID=UPI0019D60166|nr:uncharacterized protein LOC120703589 isoform X3 [Panicum virgatum]
MWTRYCLSPPTRMSPSSCDLFSAEEMEWKHRFRNFGVEYRKYRDDVIMKNNYKENMMGVEVSNPRCSCLLSEVEQERSRCISQSLHLTELGQDVADRQ